MSKTIPTDPGNTELNDNKSISTILHSAGVILILTVVFGGLSYALIKLNDSVMQLSIPESIWCGLAMALAVGYYLITNKGKRNSTTE